MMNPIRTLPEGVELAGVYKGQQVFREVVRTPVKDVVRDAAGAVVYHEDPKGRAIRTMPHTEIVEWKEEAREYTEVPLLDGKGTFTGTIQKNYHFREPEPVASEADLVEQDLREAAKVAREHGLSLTDVLRKLFSGADEPEGDEDEKTPARRGRKPREAA